MFCGTFIYRMDDRNRVAIPFKFRRELEGIKVIISMFPEGCLFLCSPREWKKIARGFKKESLSGTSEMREESEVILSEARERTVSRLGRISIPSRFREYASLQREVVFVGCNNWIEIWDPERWNKEQQRLVEKRRVNMRKLCGILKDVKKQGRKEISIERFSPNQCVELHRQGIDVEIDGDRGVYVLRTIPGWKKPTPA